MNCEETELKAWILDYSSRHTRVPGTPAAGSTEDVREAADLYVSWGQLAVPNQHDCDDIQRGLIQTPTQNPHQFICDFRTLTEPC